MTQSQEYCSSMQWRREKIIAELMTTEESYKKQLQAMIDYFETPMRIRQVIPNHSIDAIFGNVHQLIRVNHELRAYLKDHQVGEAFMKIGPFLKLYSVYAKNHHHALSTLEEWEHKSTRFVELKQRQECRPEVKMKFNALLITPVQRIPRYKLLLDNLLNHTLPTHPDYEQLKRACEEIAQVASHINNFIREHDNFNKMLQIQRSLSGNCAPKILGPGRKFIMEGPLKRVSRKGDRAFERMFFLFSDMLLYAKPRLVENGSHTYSCCCVLPLHHCTLERMFGGESGGAMMRLSCKEELLLLYHEDRDQIETWITELKKSIKEVCQSRQTLHKESSARRPMRKPDLVRTRRQERIEKSHDENKLLTPSKENAASPLVKYVRNLADIDSLCCTPKKRPNLDQNCAAPPSKLANRINDTRIAPANDDSFCIADQSEVENFDVMLPQFFTQLDIGHEQKEMEVEADQSTLSKSSVRRSLRRSISNMSQYSSRVRSSFRSLRQKTSSCSLRTKARQTNDNGRTRLEDLFQQQTADFDNSQCSEFDENELLATVAELEICCNATTMETTVGAATMTTNATTSTISSVGTTLVEERSQTQNRHSVCGSQEVLTMNEVPLAEVTPNVTPRKKVVAKRLNSTAINQKTAKKLRRGLEKVVDHVMSPVLENGPVGFGSPVAMGGYTMVSGLRNVQHLAEPVHPRGTDPNACLVM